MGKRRNDRKKEDDSSSSLTFPRIGLDLINPTNHWKGSVAPLWGFCLSSLTTPPQQPLRRAPKTSLHPGVGNPAGNASRCYSRGGTGAFLASGMHNLSAFPQKSSPQLRIPAPAEEPPPTPDPFPGSWECQGCAQMDAQLSAFLEFLPDCSHMDPDSWSSGASAPSPPPGLQPPPLPGNSGSLWEADHGIFLLPGTP